MTFKCDLCQLEKTEGFRLESLSKDDVAPEISVPAHVCEACAPVELGRLVVHLYTRQSQTVAALDLVAEMLEEARP